MEWFGMELEPDDGQICVIYDPEHSVLKVWPATYNKQRKCFTAGSVWHAGWFEYDEVAMWMPLPAPPTN